MNISGSFPKVSENSQNFLKVSKKSRKVSKIIGKFWKFTRNVPPLGKPKIYSPSGHPRWRWVWWADESVSTSEKYSIPSLAHQWIICSEWVPSEWEYHNNPQVIHTTTVHQLMCCEMKSCVCKKQIIVIWTDYCDVFISSLDSFWRHPFTPEDQLMSKWCNAKFLQISSGEQIHLHFGWPFQIIFRF